MPPEICTAQLRPEVHPGHGVVFKLSFESGTWTEDFLYSFKGGADDGSGPESALLLDAAGNLYGTTAAGGPSGNGTVFKLAPDGAGGWTETVLHAFNGIDGSLPILAPLVADAHGNLYGVTQGYCYRGTCGRGTVYELSPRQNGSWSFKVLHSFGHTGLPDAGLVLDKAGNLYGSTVFDGLKYCVTSGCGTIYKLSPSAKSWTFTTIHAFDFNDGAYPMGNLIIDSAGRLYGSTNGGGSSYNGGVAFMLAPTKTGWKETVLHTFGMPGDGQGPSSLLLGTFGPFLVRSQAAQMRITTFRTASSLSCLVSRTALGMKAFCTLSRRPMPLRSPTRI
jgi:uncharacterized repeat protein (TIGR03803 family)